MTDRPRPHDRLARLAPWLTAAALFAASMLVASSFRTPPGTGPGGSGGVAGPGASRGAGEPGRPGETTVPWAGPELYGIFAGCNPACDLEIAIEGIGRRLTTTDRAVDESAPTLSPDRSRVVFRCAEPAVEPGGAATPRPQGLGSLCLAPTIPPDSREATPPPVAVLLADPATDYGAPRWSPDGSMLAFDFRRADGETGIATWAVDAGGDPVTVASSALTPGIDPSRPAWTPDGTTLVFACGVLTLPSGNSSLRFCSMPRDGGAVMQLGGAEGDCGAPTVMPDAVHFGVVCIVPGADGGDLFILSLDEPFTHSFTTSQRIAPEGVKRVAFDPEQRYAFVRRGDALWALGIPGGEWSQPPLPPLHGDFDLQVLAGQPT